VRSTVPTPIFFSLPTDITEEEIVSYLNERGITVKENEEPHYVELMMDNHKCIEYNGVQYYIPEDNNLGIDETIYDYLIDFFHV
jgi:hypothetical protein